MSFPEIPPRLASQDTAIDTLARTIWGEAFPDSVRGKEAIAAVVLNRVARARARFGSEWWGGTVVEACLGSEQFRCWRGTPVARSSLMRVRQTDRVFAICRRIAARAVRGALIDPTHGSTHYHTFGEKPWWIENHEPAVVIGRRKFYRLD